MRSCSVFCSCHTCSQQRQALSLQLATASARLGHSLQPGARTPAASRGTTVSVATILSLPALARVPTTAIPTRVPKPANCRHAQMPHQDPSHPTWPGAQRPQPPALPRGFRGPLRLRQRPRLAWRCWRLLRSHRVTPMWEEKGHPLSSAALPSCRGGMMVRLRTPISAI